MAEPLAAWGQEERVLPGKAPPEGAESAAISFGGGTGADGSPIRKVL
jgi:hypothetical protein